MVLRPAFLCFLMAGLVQAGLNDYQRLRWEGEGWLEGAALTPHGYLRNELFHNWHSSNGSASDTKFHVRRSRLGARLELPPFSSGAALSAMGEIDFMSGTYARPHVRLRHAYLNYAMPEGWSLLAGKTYDVWYMGDPSMLVYLYPCNYRPQVRLTRSLELEDGTRLSMRLAGVQNRGPRLDVSHDHSNHDEVRHLLTQAAVIAERRLLTERLSRLTLAGSQGRERNTFAHNPAADGDKTTSLLMTTFCLPLQRHFNFSGAALQGENVDTYYLGALARGVNQQSGATIRGQGGWLQGTVICHRDLRFNYGYSFLALQRSRLAPGQRSYYACHYLNFDSWPLPRLRLVMECAYLNREIMTARDNNHFRFTMNLYVYF